MQIPSHEMSHKAATCSSSRSLDCPARDVPSHRAIVVEKSCFWPPISRVCTGYWDRYLLKTLTVPRITAVCCMHVLEYLKSWCAVPSNKFNAPTELRAGGNWVDPTANHTGIPKIVFFILGYSEYPYFGRFITTPKCLVVDTVLIGPGLFVGYPHEYACDWS